MTAQELLEKYAAGERDFSGAGLLFANLNGANLSGANLTDTDLRGADLSCADLSNANFTDADLRGANLVGANLVGADLTNCNIRWCLGNGKEIKNLLVKYHITWTDKIMAIGCEQHTLEQWYNFNDQEIMKMDEDAITWWKEWKPKLISIGVFEPIL